VNITISHLINHIGNPSAQNPNAKSFHADLGKHIQAAYSSDGQNTNFSHECTQTYGGNLGFTTYSYWQLGYSASSDEWEMHRINTHSTTSSNNSNTRTPAGKGVLLIYPNQIQNFTQSRDDLCGSANGEKHPLHQDLRSFAAPNCKSRELTASEVISVLVAVRDSEWPGTLDIQGRILTEEMEDVLAEAIIRKGRMLELKGFTDQQKNDLKSAFEQRKKVREENARAELARLTAEVQSFRLNLTQTQSNLASANRQISALVHEKKSLSSELDREKIAHRNNIKTRNHELSESEAEIKRLREAYRIETEQVRGNLETKLSSANKKIHELENRQRIQEEVHQNELEKLENRFEEKLRINHLTVRLQSMPLYDILKEFRNNAENPVIRKIVEDSIVDGIEDTNPCRISELQNLSLIALPFDDVISTRQEELRDHGAILTVSDLVQKIGGTGKPDARLQKAAEDLLQMFMQPISPDGVRILPDGVLNDLKKLIKAEEICENYARERNNLVFEKVELFLSGKLRRENARLFEQAFYAAINTLPDRDHYTNTYNNLLLSVMERDRSSNSTRRDLNKLVSRVQQVMADQLYRQHSGLCAFAAVRETGNYIDNKPRSIKDHIHGTIKSAIEGLRDQVSGRETLGRRDRINHSLMFLQANDNPNNPGILALPEPFIHFHARGCHAKG